MNMPVFAERRLRDYHAGARDSATLRALVVYFARRGQLPYYRPHFAVEPETLSDATEWGFYKYDPSFKGPPFLDSAPVEINQVSIAPARRLRALWSVEAMDDLSAFYNVTSEEDVSQVLMSQIAREIDAQIVDDILFANAVRDNEPWFFEVPGHPGHISDTLRRYGAVTTTPMLVFWVCTMHDPYLAAEAYIIREGWESSRHKLHLSLLRVYTHHEGDRPHEEVIALEDRPYEKDQANIDRLALMFAAHVQWRERRRETLRSHWLRLIEDALKHA